jgi:preprotein translocase subunit SecG
MNWLNTAAMILHMFLAVGIVGLVLLQRGKGADAGAGFGAGASGTVFGARGSASFLSRTTGILAALFFVTSLTLSYLGGRQTSTGTSVVDRVPAITVPTSPPVKNDSSQLQVPSSPAPVEQSAAPTSSASTSSK